MATITSVGSGLWSVAGTWDAGVPADNDIVVIAAGHTVEFNVDQSGFANGVNGLTITGTLKLTRTAGTYYLKMKAATYITGAGTFDAGTALDKLPYEAKHTVYISNGGIKGNTGAGMTFTAFPVEHVHKYIALTQTEAIGATVLHVDTDVTGDLWAAGDTVIISNSVGGINTEERVIAAGGISSNTITVTAGLTAAKQSGAYIILISSSLRFIGINASYGVLQSFSTASKCSINGGYYYGDYCLFTCNISGTGGLLRSPVNGRIFSSSSLVGSNFIISGGLGSGGSSILNGAGSNFDNCLFICLQSNTMAYSVFNNCIFGGSTYAAQGNSCWYYNCTFQCNTNVASIYSSEFTNCTFKNTYGFFQSMYKCKSCLFLAGDFYNPTSMVKYVISESIDHNQVAGAYKCYTAGGVTTKQAVTVPVGYDSAMQTPLVSALVEGYWQKKITIGAGASVNITMNLRKDASMTYLPRTVIFNEVSDDPLVSGTPLYTFTMTNSVDTWESDLYTYTNSTSEDVTLVIRCQGMNATGNMYSALLVEQINVDLTNAIAKIDVIDGLVDAIKAKTDLIPAAPAVADEYDAALAAIQADLDNPGQYKADVSGLATSVSLATVDSVVDAIKLKTDNLPADPAAVGSAMTLTAGERTAIANEVESQIINEADSERVLTAITDKIASVNPSLDDLTLAGIASAVRTELGTELARIDAAISSRLSSVGYTSPANADVAAIKAKTDNLPNDPADQSILAALIGALPAAPSEMDIVNALKSSVFDGILTFEDSIKLYNAILFGKLDGGGTGTLKFRNPADTKDRVIVVVDLNNGDRDDITLDLT